MARNWQKAKGRRDSHTFVQFQHRMLRDRRFLSLSGCACYTLLYLASQYNGRNNGDLSIAWSVASTKGVRSYGTLRAGVMELLEAGFVVQTRLGGRNRCSLFALTWLAIDECGGKLDIPATRVAPNDWLRKNANGEPPAVQPAPPAVHSGEQQPRNRTN